MSSDLRQNYIIITAVYWIFTLTDGALRMLVLLHFYAIGYGAFQIALLFLFYEAAGVVTNLVGGWIGARFGLKSILLSGLFIQFIALFAIANLDPSWSLWQSVGFIMSMQALSGVAKDLTKMSAKSAVRLILDKSDGKVLFKWVAILTGSKNTLKGVGFFVGGILLTWFSFAIALYILASSVAIALIFSFAIANIGESSGKVRFSSILSKTQAINILSSARFFLFGARDIWFVVGLPLFLVSELSWSHTKVAFYMAFWVIGYGFIQTIAPNLTKGNKQSASNWLLALILLTLLISIALYLEVYSSFSVLLGLALFGFIFAINSSVHSFLILAYSENDKVLLNVGFYYMANAAGRLIGTLISGLAFHLGGLILCLFASVLFLIICFSITSALPKLPKNGQRK
jgi:predicted MFS family arabinose efflux permease